MGLMFFGIYSPLVSQALSLGISVHLSLVWCVSKSIHVTYMVLVVHYERFAVYTMKSTFSTNNFQRSMLPEIYV